MDSSAPAPNPAPKTWKNLGVRFFSAVFLSAICIAPFYFGGWLWAILVAAFGGRMAYEWVRMSDPAPRLISFIIPIAGLIIGILYIVQGVTIGAVLSVFLGAGLAALERWQNPKATERGAYGPVWAALGYAYIIIPSLIIVTLRGNEVGFSTKGFTQLIFIVLVVVAADVGAYFGGSYFKGPKLAPTLSPNKTWSGFVSGLGFAIFIAMIVSLFMGMSPWIGALLALPIVLLSVGGDLLESGLKRRLKVKDTGDLLPGHGGLLDRLDSLMAAVVGAAIILALFPQIWTVS